MSIINCLTDVSDRNNIGEDSSRRDIGSGSIAFDDHRILVVSFGRDHDDVVAALQFVERVMAVDCLQADFANTFIHFGNEAETFAFGFQLLAFVFEFVRP